MLCVLWDGDEVNGWMLLESLMHRVLLRLQSLPPLDPCRLFGWQSANATGGSGTSFTPYWEKILRNVLLTNVMLSRSVQRAAALLQLSARQEVRRRWESGLPVLPESRPAGVRFRGVPRAASPQRQWRDASVSLSRDTQTPSHCQVMRVSHFSSVPQLKP